RLPHFPPVSGRHRHSGQGGEVSNFAVMWRRYNLRLPATCPIFLLSRVGIGIVGEEAKFLTSL
ncbi:MAG: hypothetical protein IJU19_00890, partial [Bacteroidales bacterium]|nr:hypothetical protein [Bacteroidales bacterium]